MRIALTTIDSRDGAETLARDIVEQKLAACVNIVSGLRSIYWWEGEVQSADELLLLIKTSADRVGDLEQFVRERHPYELPEFVVIEPQGASAEYLDWVRRSSSQ